MNTVEDSLLIDAPAGPLFDLSQDYQLRTAWDPFVRELRFLDGATAPAPGVRVWVRAWTGLTMTVEYVTVNRPHVVAMRMTEGPRIFRNFAGSWRFEQASGARTRVVFRYAFETRPRWLRWLLDPVVARIFRRDIRARLKGLKNGAERAGLLARLASRTG